MTYQDIYVNKCLRQSLYLCKSFTLQVCVTFVFGALLEYALVNYASRSDAQRLAKKKVQKQWEIDHQSFDPLHMEDALPPGPGQASAAANNGGSFAMVSINHHQFIWRLLLRLMIKSRLAVT